MQVSAKEAKIMDTVVFAGPPVMEQIIWPAHCIQNTDGARLHPDLKVRDDRMYVKVKVVFLYSAVSSPLDRSKRFTLFAFPDSPVHSDTVLGFSGKHSSHAAITRQD